MSSWTREHEGKDCYYSEHSSGAEEMKFAKLWQSYSVVYQKCWLASLHLSFVNQAPKTPRPRTTCDAFTCLFNSTLIGKALRQTSLLSQGPRTSALNLSSLSALHNPQPIERCHGLGILRGSTDTPNLATSSLTITAVHYRSRECYCLGD